MTPIPTPPAGAPEPAGSGRTSSGPACERADPPLALRPDSPALRMAAIARRDQAAFAAFHEETLPRAWALALRIVRQAELAEEVVEDAYMQVWRDADRFDPTRGPPIAWLLTIVRSRALDALRRRPDTVPLDDEPAVGDDGPTGADPCDLLQAMQRGHAVSVALATLKPLQRQLIGCAFLRGMTHQEIADAWGMPLGTVKSTLRLALLALRGRLDGIA